ncbi:hypothetical protein [Synechococcus sp. M16CYN]|uniref:hypothetical protein n=1 Tax=Synechococcus sp. M16CYN TaxID=3103139 RepID=UPI003340F225
MVTSTDRHHKEAGLTKVAEVMGVLLLLVMAMTCLVPKRVVRKADYRAHRLPRLQTDLN